MTTYAIHAQVLTHDGDYAGSKAVPTFYLDSRVQGIITEEHAARVAAGIVNPLGLIPAADLRVSAFAVDDARESAELDACVADRERAAEHAQMTAAFPGHAEWCAGAAGHARG